MYQMSGQRFAFSKQRHLFPESPWFPKIEAELNSTLSTKESDPYFTASADIAFILGVPAEREKLGFIFFLYLVTFTLSTQNKMDGKASAGPLDISLLIDQGHRVLARKTRTLSGHPRNMASPLGLPPSNLKKVFLSWKNWM